MGLFDIREVFSTGFEEYVCGFDLIGELKTYKFFFAG